MKTNLLFSVIIPTYSRPQSLLKVLAALEGQIRSSFEVIVVDDSVDSISNDILKYNYPLFYFNRGNRLGVSSARNFGARHARGKYLVFLDDDDEFSNSWLSDFKALIDDGNYVDLLQCGMSVSQNLGLSSFSYLPDSKDQWRLIIPGSWAISKDLFFKIGGYDEQLRYGENTELFFRLETLGISRKSVSRLNFIYLKSLDGGSRNLINIIESSIILMQKHKKKFSENKELKVLYLQAIGVCNLRLYRFAEARKFLLRAFLLKPYSIKIFLRLLISIMPIFSRFIYSQRVVQQN